MKAKGKRRRSGAPWTKQLSDRALKVRYRRLFRSFRAQRKYPDLTRGDVPSSLAPGFHIAAPLALRESDMTFEGSLSGGYGLVLIVIVTSLTELSATVTCCL